MNKTALALGYLCLFSLPLRTQTEAGAWLFAPATFSHTWSADNEEDIIEQANFLTFKALYFPFRRLAIGGQLQYNGYRADETGFYLERQISWWFMPTLRYYLPAPGNRTHFFAEAGGSFFLNRYRFGSDLNSWGGIAGIGLNTSFNDYMALEVIAGYFNRRTRERALNGQVEAYDQRKLDLQLSLRFFLPSAPAAKEPLEKLAEARWALHSWIDLDSDDDGVRKRHPFFLRGRIAFFPAPLLALGVEGGVDLGGQNLFDLKIGAAREGGFFARYYLMPAGALSLFPELGWSAGRDIYPGFYSSRTRTLKAGLGAAARLNDRFALETLLQYRRHRFYTEDNDLIAIRQNSLGLEVNLVYFVFAKKTGV